MVESHTALIVNCVIDSRNQLFNVFIADDYDDERGKIV